MGEQNSLQSGLYNFGKEGNRKKIHVPKHEDVTVPKCDWQALPHKGGALPFEPLNNAYVIYRNLFWLIIEDVHYYAILVTAPCAFDYSVDNPSIKTLHAPDAGIDSQCAEQDVAI